MNPEPAPVIEVAGRYRDEDLAREVADALNVWFRWILNGSEGAPPEAFDALGVPTADYAWSLADDVDWEVGPHARVVGEEVRIALQTDDTHVHLSGLLRRLGALATRVARDQT